MGQDSTSIPVDDCMSLVDMECCQTFDAAIGRFSFLVVDVCSSCDQGSYFVAESAIYDASVFYTIHPKHNMYAICCMPTLSPETTPMLLNRQYSIQYFSQLVCPFMPCALPTILPKTLQRAFLALEVMRID